MQWGFKRHIVMAAPIAVTASSSVQNLKKGSSRRFDGKSMSLDDRDYGVELFQFLSVGTSQFDFFPGQKKTSDFALNNRSRIQSLSYL